MDHAAEVNGEADSASHKETQANHHVRLTIDTSGSNPIKNT